jgi:predicted TPR repeat methyltransferase
MIVCSPINYTAEKLLGRSPSINTAKVKRKPYTKKWTDLFTFLPKNALEAFSLLYISDTIFPYWPYILFIERLVPVVWSNLAFKGHFLFTSETTGKLNVLEPFTMPTRYESKFNNVLIMRDIAKYFKGNEVFNIRFLFQVKNYRKLQN